MAKVLEKGYDGMVFTLNLEDDSEMECTVLMTFEEGGKEYMALHPLGDEFEEYDALIIEFSESESGAELEDIDDEDEYDKVFEKFVELFDEVFDEDGENYEIVEESFGRE